MTDDHLSIDELAELDEGLLPPKRTSAARAHLLDCAQCRAGADAIAATRSLLSSLPAEPMPEDVKERLDQALAQEASARSRSTTVVPNNVVTMKRRGFGRPTMAASAAAAAVVLLIGAVVIAHGNSSNSGENAGSTTANAPGLPVSAPPLSSHGNYATHATGRNYTLASLPNDISSLLAVTASPVPSAPAPGPNQPAPSVAASANGVKSTKHAKSTFSSAAGVATSGSPDSLVAGRVPQSLQPLFSSPKKLLACAAFMSPTVGELPIAVDFGRWSGPPFTRAPSVIFVYSDTASTVRVVVVGPACDGNAIRQFTEVQLSH